MNSVQGWLQFDVTHFVLRCSNCCCGSMFVKMEDEDLAICALRILLGIVCEDGR